jgi:hypothetical protein
MNPEVEKNLKALEAQINELNDLIREVSDDVRKAGFSQYPIFVAHQEVSSVGDCILDRTEFDFPYSLNATTLERFIELGLLSEDRKVAFLQAWGDPAQQLCLFWVNGEFTRFIFKPFRS